MKRLREMMRTMGIFEKVDLDVVECKVFPLDLANNFRENSKRRNSFAQAAIPVMVISCFALVADVVAFLLLNRLVSDLDATPFLIIGILSALNISLSSVVNKSHFHFDECNPKCYQEISKWKAEHKAISTYVEAIKASGRDWICNYEFRAMHVYINEMAKKKDLELARDNALESRA